MTTYTLVEREKLGPNAYRITWCSEKTSARDEAMATFESISSAAAYGPDGSHTLVLLAKEEQ